MSKFWVALFTATAILGATPPSMADDYDYDSAWAEKMRRMELEMERHRQQQLADDMQALRSDQSDEPYVAPAVSDAEAKFVSDGFACFFGNVGCDDFARKFVTGQ